MGLPPQCQRIAPVFTQLAADMPDVVFVKVDVDENEEVAAECGIQAMPTFQYYKNKTKVHEFSGASEDKIKEAIAKYIDGSKAPMETAASNGIPLS